jgi:hypothetical protein
MERAIRLIYSFLPRKPIVFLFVFLFFNILVKVWFFLKNLQKALLVGGGVDKNNKFFVEKAVARKGCAALVLGGSKPMCKESLS